MNHPNQNQAPGGSAPAGGASKAALKGRSTLPIDAIGLLLCAAMAMGWCFISLAPHREARAARQALWDDLQPRLEKISTLEHQARVQQRALTSVGEEIARGQLQLRGVDQINQRIADLTHAAGAYKLRLDEVRPGTPVAMQWFMTVPIKLSGSGEYPDLGVFLHRLPTDFPDVAVTGFNLRGEPEAIDKTPKFELNLVWYAAPRIVHAAKGGQ